MGRKWNLLWLLLCVFIIGYILLILLCFKYTLWYHGYTHSSRCHCSRTVMSNLYLTLVYYSLQVTSTLSMETLTIPGNLLSNPSSDCPEIVLGTVITELRNHWSLWCGQPVGTLICAADLLVVVAHTGTTLLFHLGLSVCTENDGKRSNRLYGTCLLACMCTVWCVCMRAWKLQ